MSRLVLVIASLLVLCALGITAATMLHASPATHASSAPRPVARLEGTDIWPADTRPAPAFALHDQTGRLITRDGLRGHVWAITFLDSSCKQACPIEARALALVQRRLGPKLPLQVIVVSVLPSYDTPARVKAFAREAGLKSNWHWLLGSEKELRPVWNAYGIQVIAARLHTAALYLVDRRGDVRVADGVPFLNDQLTASVRALYERA